MPSPSRSSPKRPQPTQRALDELAQRFGQGQLEAAEVLALQLTQRFPAHGYGWKVLGVIRLQQQRFAESAAATRAAIPLLAGDASTHNNLGAALLGLEQMPAAHACFLQALEIAPGYAKAHFNLSKVLRSTGQLQQAELHCRSAVASDPAYAAAHFSLGNLLELQNRITEAIASYRTALDLEPANATIFSDMLHLMSHDVNTAAADNLAAHQRFGQQFEAPLRDQWPAHPNRKDPGRQIKLGFVSSDAYDHALANYLEPLFRLLNKKPGLEVHLYFTHAKEDAVTRRLRGYFSHWHEVSALSEAALDQRIRSDGIDILVDVNGHTVMNKLLTFARKPAPIQISWLGYLGTSGLQAMDYYVSDTYWIPPGQLDWQFVEKLAYLPAAVVFEPNANAPPVNALPALSNGYISFGSFNRLNKINDAVIALWSLLLNQVAGSRLKLGAIPQEHRNDLTCRFEAHGVAAHRISFFNRTIQTEYLAQHHQVDFCLDTFPFCAGATSAQAAWMGVPTLTLAGELPASRLGATQMHQLGLDGFVADSIDDFLAKGLYWAAQVQELAALRAGLRERFSQSSLGQTVAFADHFEAMLRSMWQRWCQDLPAASFQVEAQSVADMPPDLAAAPATGEPPPALLETLLNRHARQEHAQVEALARSLTQNYPEHGAGWKYLGAALRALGRLQECLAVLRQTVQQRPQDYEAHFNLASELQQQGLFDAAVRSYLDALALQPNNPAAYNNLANIFKLMSMDVQAEQYCRQALALKPDMSGAVNNLGNALHAQGRYAEAEREYRRALELKPDWAEVYNNLAICLKDQGYSSEAEQCYRKTLALKPEWSAAHSNMLFSLSLDVQTSPELLHAEHLAFARQFEVPLQAARTAHANSREPERLLQVGFVSADLYDHAMASFLEPLFKALAGNSDLSLHAYYVHIYEDAVTERLRSCFQHWHAVAHLSEQALAELVRADQIDILIDLSGHTAHNRMLSFARKPAPVQATYLGYLGTSGLQAMDYFLCDEFWVPAQQLDWQFSEKMAYLPGAVVFQPSEHAAAVNTLPALANGHITFGSFNRPNKLNDSVIALWSMLLQAVPTAHMVFGGIAPERQEELFRRFMAHGVDINRLTFFPRSNIQDYLALHHQVDFCLDTFPYGGGATNANAAWMGVPTLCLAGETPASRFGPTGMHILGLDAFIADSIEDFIAKGVYWAAHTKELAELRAGMRERFQASPMGQPQQFAADFKRLLRAMWRRWCDDLPPDTLGLAGPAGPAPVAASAPPASRDAQEALMLEWCEQGCDAQAEELARSLANSNPTRSLAWTVLAQICQRQNRFEEAAQALEGALAADPADATLRNNQGVVLMALNRLAEAEHALRLSLANHPAYGKALVNLATVLRLQGRAQEAEAICRDALQIDDTDASAWVQLGNTLEAQDRPSQAQACYYKADMAHEPRRAVAHSNVLYLMNHDVLVEPQHLVQEHLAFGETFEAPLRGQWQAHTNNRDPLRKLKVGFVSGDFCNHALTPFLEPAFKALSTRPSLEMHAYSTRLEEDAVTQRLRWYFGHWSQVASLSNEQLAEKIRADGIDILVDLSGHTARNRLLTFALKPAPVQVGWVGYLGTSGLQAMDYYLCDEHWLPQDQHAWQFTEKLAYLPSSVVFAPGPQAPPVNALPALANGHVTFGSFNRISKINDAVIALWSLLMQRVPGSRILLAGVEAQSCTELSDSFAAHGIEATRLMFVPRLEPAAYLALHHQVDCCLDTYPHGGGATTAHAAWMGVPSLSLAGETPASRFGAALMHHLGLSQFVATDINGFVEAGIALTNNLMALASIRSGLRSRFVESPLGSAQQFANGFEATLRTMWSVWCEAQPPLPIACAPQDRGSPTSAQLVIVSATQLSEADFWARSALGQSLRSHMARDARISTTVAFENRRGLPEIFNRAMDQAPKDAALVFVHDDVWIDETYLVDSIWAGLSQFDVLGVAGNRRRMPGQPAWSFINEQLTWDAKAHLSGRVGHGKNAGGHVSDFGPTPARCELLDGVFLAATARTLVQHGVRFDTQFDFHFYDLDFCRAASAANLVLGTWPLALTHQSPGVFGSPSWREKYQLYAAKWETPARTPATAASPNNMFNTKDSPMQTSLDYVVGTLDHIEKLQIYSPKQADTFFGMWAGDIDYMRFELVSLPDNSAETISIDLTLRSGDGLHNFIVVGVIISDKGLRFPSILGAWGAEALQMLADRIGQELLTRRPQNYEIRTLHSSPRLAVNEMTIERVLPGFRDYTTAVNHIKRYTFLLDHIQPGSIMECACGTGYGAAILARLDHVTHYYGVDLSPVATAAAQGNVVADPRFGFHNVDLAEPHAQGFQNVMSLETIEHTPNPYAFLELLINKMAPGGQLLLSLPTEIWGGSHRNPYHFSNWTRKRFITFVEQYFEDVTFYSQRLSLMGPTTFEMSDISDSAPSEDADECFVAILKRPRNKKRPTIVVKRLEALGDVIWITPLLATMRRNYPGHNLIMVTNKTEVFINNPDVDLVFCPKYEPAESDLVIDLDRAYEQRRSMHLLDAYADASGVPMSQTTPRLYPTSGHYKASAGLLKNHFQSTSALHLLAIHMAASSPDRVWPKVYWRALIDKLLQSNPSLGIVVLGQGKDFSAKDIGLKSDRVMCLTHQCDLMHTAATLAHCDVLLAPDSGLLHIAAAVDTPYLGLFGMANPATRLPLKGAHQAIWADIECRGCLQDLPADAPPVCRLGYAKCMDNITPDMVEPRLNAMLGNQVMGNWQTRVLMTLDQRVE